MAKQLYEVCPTCENKASKGLFTCDTCNGRGFVKSILLQTVLEVAIDNLRGDITDTETKMNYYITTTFVTPEMENVGKQYDMLSHYKQGLQAGINYLQNVYEVEFGKPYPPESETDNE